MTEFKRMTAGYYVNTMCKSILLQMARGYILARWLNRTSLSQKSKRNHIAKWLFGSVGKSCCIGSSLSIEYGKNVHIGNNFSAGENLVIQDGAPINIGNDVSIESNVVITTVLHSLCAKQRKVQWIPQRFPRKHKGLFIYNKPITIGNHVQIGVGATICAGVTIGDGTVIGARSVVTRDIPPNVLAYGVPCRVIRPITEADRVSHEELFDGI
ncbi:MAG: sugar O-acetyltransferase [Oscillospiraceae bacterium]|nr:sugar O-acetyltransferase [Oscillospiraceae bacterium]